MERRRQARDQAEQVSFTSEGKCLVDHLDALVTLSLRSRFRKKKELGASQMVPLCRKRGRTSAAWQRSPKTNGTQAGFAEAIDQVEQQCNDEQTGKE
jgi:hypothetical protein